MSTKDEMNTLNYGENVVYFLRDLAANEVDDITSGEFDVYGEDDQGREGCAVIDVTLLAADAVSMITRLQEQVKALAAENLMLKSGPQGFFSYSSDCGYEEHDTAEKAREFAEEEIAGYREQACDGWSDEVGSVVWGVVMQRASMTGLRPVEEGDNCAEGFTEWCDYTLLPKVETPATDAFIAEIKAQAFDEVAAGQRGLAEVRSRQNKFQAENKAIAFAQLMEREAAQLRAKPAKDGV